MNFSHFRQRLFDELDKIEQSLQASQSAGETVMLDQSSVGRLTRMDAMQQQAMASELTERLQRSKRKAQAALNRLNAGTYGLCCACEADIDPSRLAHDPAAVFCHSCMEERDAAQRGH